MFNTFGRYLVVALIKILCKSFFKNEIYCILYSKYCILFKFKKLYRSNIGWFQVSFLLRYIDELERLVERRRLGKAIYYYRKLSIQLLIIRDVEITKGTWRSIVLDFIGFLVEWIELLKGFEEA